jgi:magnesium-transporting ATPase (P-type)
MNYYETKIKERQTKNKTLNYIAIITLIITFVLIVIASFWIYPSKYDFNDRGYKSFMRQPYIELKMLIVLSLFIISIVTLFLNRITIFGTLIFTEDIFKEEWSGREVNSDKVDKIAKIKYMQNILSSGKKENWLRIYTKYDEYCYKLAFDDPDDRFEEMIMYYGSVGVEIVIDSCVMDKLGER